MNSIVRQGPGTDIAVTATQPSQLSDLHSNLVDWAHRRVALAEAELSDAQSSLNVAAHRFAVDPLKRLVTAAQMRLEFYQKMAAALEDGYVLMPTMAAQIFAVRTNAKTPPFIFTRYQHHIPDVQAKGLQKGKGRWVNPIPFIEEFVIPEKDSAGNEVSVTKWRPESIDEKITFPLMMAKPEIIEATSRAMALGIFDEIGLLPPSQQGDPVIVGRIIAPGKASAQRRRRISFLIAWHVDTRDL